MLRFLAVVLLSLHLTCGENLSLEPEGVKSRRFTFEGGEYEISALRTSWYTARNYCKIQGGHLLSIETMEENTAIMQALGDLMTESIWTSGSDIDKAELFYWDATGAPFENFTFWGPARPIVNNTEHCVLLNSEMSHMWADAECDREKLFICEFHSCSDKLQHENNVAKEIKNPLLRFTFENGTYEIFDDLVSWVDAKSACKLKGMELVSIETLEENLAILNAIISYPETHFWTSGTAQGHLDNFYWEGTGHIVGPYTGWTPGQPNDPINSICIILWHLYSHMWADVDCTYLANYICELQPCQS